MKHLRALILIFAFVLLTAAQNIIDSKKDEGNINKKLDKAILDELPANKKHNEPSILIKAKEHRKNLQNNGSAPKGTEQLTEAEDNSEESSDYYKAFISSFTVIVLSEIGDKTFLIAAILSMTHNRLTIFAAASSALVIMTVLSALLGATVFQFLPKEYTELIAGILFIIFGVKMLRETMTMESDTSSELEEVEEELKVKRREDDEDETDLESAQKQEPSGLKNLLMYLFSPVFVQTFTMTFLAEWGDRSQIATIALAAANNLIFVSIGASIAHCLCTAAAIAGGRLLATKISVRTVTLFGGIMFLVFGFYDVYSATYN